MKAAAALVAAAMVLTACGDDGNPEPSNGSAGEPTNATDATPNQPTESAPPDEPPSAATPSLPPFPTGVRRQTGEGSGEPIVLSDVRLAQHQGFDRIVLEFSGTGTAGWTVNNVDKAVLDGSGDVVQLGDGSILDIHAANTTWPAPDYYDGPERPPRTGDVPEVFVAGTFEGYTQVLAGVDGPRTPFRVFTLTQPSRLVVDIVDDTAG